jgi:capsular polysaccharide biosynthesis protein
MEEIDLKEMFDYFKGKIVWILCTMIVFVILGNTYTILSRVPMYRSSTTIVLVSEHSESYNASELQLNKNLVGTYSEIIKSRRVLEPVIENLGLDYSYGELKSNVNVSPVTNAEIIRISVGDKDAAVATSIANEIANVFSTEVQKIYKLNNVSVVDKAVDSLKPYNINYFKDNIIYAGIAIMLSCGIIFIKFYFDTTIKTGEEIENKLGLTVLGIVPKVDFDKE